MIFERLIKRENEGGPIRVAIVGVGMMGAGVANQISRMRGIQVTLIADLVVDRAIQVFIN